MKIESTYGIGNQSILPSFPIIMKEYVPGVTNPNRGVLTMMVFSKLWSTEAIRSWGLIVQNAQLSNPKIIMEGTARAQKSAEIWFQVETFLSCVSFFFFLLLYCFLFILYFQQNQFDLQETQKAFENYTMTHPVSRNYDLALYLH